MRFVLCVAIMISSAMIARALAGKLLLRDLFFKELLDFLEKLKINYSFKKETIKKVIDEHESCKDSGRLGILLKAYLSDNMDACLSSKQLGFLKDEEKQMLKQFFAGLGKGNIEAELENTNVFQAYISQKSQEAQEARTKNQSLYYKLSLAVGVVVCILII